MVAQLHTQMSPTFTRGIGAPEPYRNAGSSSRPAPVARLRWPRPDPAAPLTAPAAVIAGDFGDWPSAKLANVCLRSWKVRFFSQSGRRDGGLPDFAVVAIGVADDGVFQELRHRHISS